MVAEGTWTADQQYMNKQADSYAKEGGNTTVPGLTPLLGWLEGRHCSYVRFMGQLRDTLSRLLLVEAEKRSQIMEDMGQAFTHMEAKPFGGHRWSMDCAILKGNNSDEYVVALRLKPSKTRAPYICRENEII